MNDDETRANINVLSGILTNGLSVQTIKAYASDRAATGTGGAVTFKDLEQTR
jgi:hypothetical protein